MFKINNENTRTTSLTLFRYLFCYFEHISHSFLLLLLLTLFVGMFLSRIWSNECSTSCPLFTFAPLWFFFKSIMVFKGFKVISLWFFFHLCSFCFSHPAYALVSDSLTYHGFCTHSCATSTHTLVSCLFVISFVSYVLNLLI